MHKLRTLALASVLGLTAITAASAEVYFPQIPNPANPHPAFPIATDGTPLPPMGWAADLEQGYSTAPAADIF